MSCEKRRKQYFWAPKLEKFFWGRMPPEPPSLQYIRRSNLPFRAYTFKTLRYAPESGVQNWLATLFWCSILFGCSTVRLTCLIYKQLLIGQVKMDSSGPVSTNKQGLLGTKQIQKFCYWHILAFWHLALGICIQAIKGHRPRCSRSSAFKLLSRSQ